MGTAHMACDPKGEIYMSKFEIPTEEALRCALHNAKDGDFLKEVADALENNLSVIFRGHSMSVQIELPEGGSSVWELAEFFTAPPSNPAADVLYKFVRRW